MFKFTMGLLLALILSGCSSLSENNPSDNNKNNTSSYVLTESDKYAIETYAEHINVILLHDNKTPKLEKLYFTLKTRVKLVEEKTQDQTVSSLEVIRISFLGWWVNYLFTDGDFVYMQNFIESTIESIKSELKLKQGSDDVELAQSKKEMASELVINIAEFYYCDKMGSLKISSYHSICNKYIGDDETKSQRRKKVYDDFVKHQRELNNLK